MTTDHLAPSALYRLMTWLSPSFPVGAFSYSHGLEWMVETGAVHDEMTLAAWVRDVLREGSGWCDAVFVASAHDACRCRDLDALDEIAELAIAFCPSAERFLETTAQGTAFADAVQAAWLSPTLDGLRARRPGPVAYPVAVAVAAADHGIPRSPALLAYLHAFSANLISAGLRLIPLGQSAGQRVTVAVEPALAVTAERVCDATLADLGSGLLLTDIASMQHETQYTRLFRS